MTYIEFFDKVAAENISACLTYAPDRVIYIGDNDSLMKKHIARYERLFEGRGYSIEFQYRTVSKSNLDSAVALLSEIVESYDDCVFDITGGEEILNLALGIVYSRYPDRQIQIHRFNIRNNTVCDCDKDGVTIFRETPTLTIDENVLLYGGVVVYGGVEEDNTYKWELDPEFLNDIEQMWDICKGDVRYWNMQIGILAAAEKVGKVSDDGLTTSVSRSTLDRYLSKRRIKYKKAKGIINRLLDCRLLTFFDDEDGTSLTVSYKNKQVKKCLTKAGQALEMKVYTAARSVLEADGEPVYDDACNGVVIDWDGEPHDEEIEGVYDTENEVDVLLMHDIVPVFISCKNGDMTPDELYKLETVANRFGGPYSKKVLVATAMDSLGETGEYIRQRAKDMKIRLIENIKTLSDRELAKTLRNLWRN